MGDGADVKFAGFKKNFSNVTGSAGLAYEAGRSVTLKFNVARGFRAPSIPELASNGAHEGTNRYEYGEQDLKSETSLQTDAGIEIASEHVSFNASVFYNSLKILFIIVNCHLLVVAILLLLMVRDEFFAFRFTQGNARLYGAGIQP